MAFVVGAAAGVALMDYFSSKGQHLSITDTISTSMSINATTNVSTECFVALDAEQIIDIEPDTLTGAQTQALADACAQCQKDLQAIYTARTKLEGDAQARNLSYKAQVPNPDINTMMQTGGWSGTPGVPQTSPTAGALGPCTAICPNVIVVGVFQQSTLTAQANCTVTNDITNSLQQNIQGQISAYLKNQQDIVGQLESAFTSNTEAISANLATTMGQNVTNNFIEDLSQAMSSMQSFKVTGSSIIASNVTQSFNGNMVGSLNVSNTVNDQLRQSASYSIAQSLLNKNDTIGDLSTDFLQVINTMSQLMEELASQILIIIGAVLAAVMLVIGSLYIFNKNFHSWAGHALGTAADAELEHYRLMQTDGDYRQQVARDEAQRHQQKLQVAAQQHQQNLERMQAQSDVDQRLTENELLMREQQARLKAEEDSRWFTYTPEQKQALIQKKLDEMPLSEKVSRAAGGFVGGIGTGAAYVAAAAHGVFI